MRCCSLGLWVALAGCTPLPCGEEIPITGDTWHRDAVAEIRGALRDFLAWTDLEVCLDEIEIVHDAPWKSTRSDRRVRINTRPAPDASRANLLWQELCGAVDDARGFALSNHPAFAEGAFVPGAQPLDDPGLLPNHKARQNERLAQWCRLGPFEPTIVAIEEACGHHTPAVMMERIWKNAPFAELGEVRITTPSEREAVEIAPLPGAFNAWGDRLLAGWYVDEDAQTKSWGWILLDDALQPTLEFILEEDVLVAASDDRIWVRSRRGPVIVLTGEGQLPTQLPREPWEGGFAADRLWLWHADAPDELIEALPDGTIVERHPMPQRDGPEPGAERYFFKGDRPAMRVWTEHTNRLVSLPDGEILAELPVTMSPHRWVDGGVAGQFGYLLGDTESTHVITDDLVLRSGELWLDANGTVYASLRPPSDDCAAEPEILPGRMEAFVPEVLSQQLWGVTRRWPVD